MSMKAMAASSSTRRMVARDWLESVPRSNGEFLPTVGCRPSRHFPWPSARRFAAARARDPRAHSGLVSWLVVTEYKPSSKGAVPRHRWLTVAGSPYLLEVEDSLGFG